MRPAGQPGRPILRRGPQRRVRDAITMPGIPIAQPQQAVFTPVEQGNAVSDEEATQLPARDNSRAALLHSAYERNDATVSSPAALLSHPTQLPLRLRSALEALDARIASNAQAEGTTPTPPNPLPRPAGPAPPRNIENGNQQPTQPPSAGPSANTPELRGGGGPVSLARARDITQGPVYAPSPLNQMQRPSSPTQPAFPGDPTKSSGSPSIDYSTLRSNKCSAQTPHNTRCHDGKYLPSSEPRRGSGRQTAVTRSRSSGDAPSFSVTCQSTSTLADPSNDVPVTSAMTQAPSRHRRGPSNLYSEDGSTSSARNYSSNMEALRQSDQTSPRLRDRGSGATSASAAYSWYGSLGSDTQFPGSEQSQSEESCPQLDGVRANPHRLSPLPSMPYTRVQTDSTCSSPPSGHPRQTSGGHVAATTAVTHDLQSPLDPYVEHYQRRQQAPHTLLNLATHANPSISSAVGFPIDGPNSDDGASHQQPLAEYHAYSNSREFSRMGEYTRLEQRSSENALVSAPVNQGDGTRHGQVQTQRAVYERLQNAIHTTYAGGAGGVGTVSSRHNVPPRNPPHDVSNRARNHVPHDSTITGMQDDSEVFHSGSSSGMHQPRRPSQGQTQSSRQHSAEFAEPPGPRVYYGASGALRVQPRREGPLSGLASLEQGSGITSRQAHSPLVRAAPMATARTYRRIRAEQRDQENVGDEILMRREEANVVARYGEEEQRRTTMNETPPRIGRVERRMME